MNLIQKLQSYIPNESRDICEELLCFANMLESGSMSVLQFSNQWNGMKYKANLFQSSLELSLISDAITELIEMFFVMEQQDSYYFAREIRCIIFQYGSGMH